MNLKLRPWTMNDLESLVKYANNYNIAKFLTDRFPHPYTLEDGKAFIEFTTKDNPIKNFAIDIDGEAVGGIGIHPHSYLYRKNAELGYWLGEPFWGQGIITNVIKKMVEFAFNTYDINRVYAKSFGTNLASQKVLKKAGFKLEGRFKKVVFKNGEYVDELVYAIRRKAY